MAIPITTQLLSLCPDIKTKAFQGVKYDNPKKAMQIKVRALPYAACPHRKLLNFFLLSIDHSITY